MNRPLLFAAIAASAFAMPHQPVMTRDTFLATEWHLAGDMFSMMPASGFRITFHPDGSVGTRNLGRVTRWSLSDKELVMWGDGDDPRRGDKPIRMTWLPDRGMFRECHLPSRLGLYLFPEGKPGPSPMGGCRDVPTAVLKLQIVLDKAVYQPGDRIEVTATLTNVGDAPIDVRRSADETGRSDGFIIDLRKDLRSALRYVSWPPSAVAAGSNESLSPGGANRRKLVLNGMLLNPLEPGKYTLRTTYLATYPDGLIGIDAEPVTLEVRPPAVARK